jgi:hypothetical protein
MTKRSFRNITLARQPDCGCLIANSTTWAVKARLIEQAREHERIAVGVEEEAEALAVS